MPVSIRSVGGGRYQVRTPNQVHAKATTKAKAVKQERLLNAIEHNPNFRPRASKKAKRNLSRGYR